MNDDSNNEPEAADRLRNLHHSLRGRDVLLLLQGRAEVVVVVVVVIVVVVVVVVDLTHVFFKSGEQCSKLW